MSWIPPKPKVHRAQKAVPLAAQLKADLAALSVNSPSQAADAVEELIATVGVLCDEFANLVESLYGLDEEPEE